MNLRRSMRLERTSFYEVRKDDTAVDIQINEQFR